MISKIVLLLIFVVALAYVVFPFDFIPDAVPIVGWIDDFFVGLMGLIALVKSLRS